MCVNATQCITSKLIYLSIVAQKINILNANNVCGGFFSLNCEKKYFKASPMFMQFG